MHSLFTKVMSLFMSPRDRQPQQPKTHRSKEITAIHNDGKVTRKQAVQMWQDENPTHLEYAKAVKSKTKSNPVDNTHTSPTQLTNTISIPPISSNTIAPSPTIAHVTESIGSNKEPIVALATPSVDHTTSITTTNTKIEETLISPMTISRGSIPNYQKA